MIKLVPTVTNIDFIGKRKLCAILSASLLALTVLLIAFKGMNWGIDFSGGTLIQIQTEKEVHISELRSSLESAGAEGFSLQEFEGSDNEFLVRLANKSEGKVTSAQQAEFVTQSLEPVTGAIEIRRVEFVGPQIGDELRTKGLFALGMSMLAILIYISVRFEMRYAIGAVAALFHDVFLTVGVFSLLGKEVTMPVLAALLTIVGYSLNDTIVVFDRVRENIRKNGKMSLVNVLNLSVNEMLNRTLMTSLTTLVVLLALFFLGGGVIHDFAFTLMFGVIVGTYSSVFVAAPVLLAMEGYYQRIREEEERTGYISEEAKNN